MSQRSWTHFRPIDLTATVTCDHLLSLEREAHCGRLERQYRNDPALELLQLRGAAHEQRHLERLRSAGLSIVEIAAVSDQRDAAFWAHGITSTRAAMHEGADVIYQAPLSGEGYSGIADFLLKVPTPSDLGAWSYEVLDAKLSAEAKSPAIVQLCLYSELVGRVQGRLPDQLHVLTGGRETPLTFRYADFVAYYGHLRRTFLAAARDPGPVRTYPEPVEQCGVCSWHAHCDGQRRADDHLSLVARLSRRHQRALTRHGIGTRRELAQLPLDPRPRVPDIAGSSLVRVREQARLQLEGAGRDVPVFELLPPEAGHGLAALPEPSEGDVFFDIEADHYTAGGGLEYLFGIVTVGPSGTPDYRGFWAENTAEERAAFCALIELLVARSHEYPHLHIYHYGVYETGALKRLMYRHGIHDRAIDDFLRRQVFVDLNRIVVQSLRASVESYSLKHIEKLCAFERRVPPPEASKARKHFLLSLEASEPELARSEHKRLIEEYNSEDCLATWRLRDWLEARRGELILRGHGIERPDTPNGELSDKVQAYLTRASQARDALVAHLPTDGAELTPEERARQLLADLLEFHRRESNASAWEYYAWTGLTDDELLDERGPIAGLKFEESSDAGRGSRLLRFSFPAQEHSLRPGTDIADAATGKITGEVHAIDDSECWIVIKRGKTRTALPHPTAVLPRSFDVRTDALADSLLRTAERVIERGLDSPDLALIQSLLLRASPSTAPGASLVNPGEDVLTAAKRLALNLSGHVLPIQGPPGSGKTYAGARMIVELIRRGLRVGITAHSHRAICNLLAAVYAAGLPESARSAQASDEDNFCGIDAVQRLDNSGLAKAASAERFDLIAGSAWLWARESLHNDPVDVLFIDEAGQMSLANTLVMAPAAHAVVLLGDPQQLPQPQKALHPPGAEVSTLQHILNGSPTIDPRVGLFLEKTWRLHPNICAFISQTFYEGRLHAAPSASRQRLFGPAPFDGAGLRYVAVDQDGNASESPEEVATVARLVEQLLNAHATWVAADGSEAPVTLNDILVVAPYNAQVQALSRALPDGARVGTVDKFQGQEAPVVIYSMATSTIEDAPRGMDFVLNANRFNVAISRARCVAVLVASPTLLQPKCRTPDEMRLANAFCRFLELATLHGGFG